MLACCTPKNQIRHVAQHYLDATGRYDIPDACRYCTPRTADGLRRLDTTVMRIVDSSYIASNMPATIKITSIEVLTDTTAVVTYHKNTPSNDFDGTLDMVRRDGNWMADVAITIPPIFLNRHYEFKQPETPPTLYVAPADSVRR